MESDMWAINAGMPSMMNPVQAPAGNMFDSGSNAMKFDTGGGFNIQNPSFSSGGSQSGQSSGGITNGTVLGTTGAITNPNNLSREQWRDKWMGSGTRDIGGLQQFLAQNGGQLLSGNGTARTPFGDVLDLLIGARTGGQGSPGWTRVDQGGSPGNSAFGMQQGNNQQNQLGGILPLLLQMLMGGNRNWSQPMPQQSQAPQRQISNGTLFQNNPSASMDISPYLGSRGSTVGTGRNGMWF